MLSLSVLESFTPHQAVAISAQPDAPRLLRELLAKNALLSYSPDTNNYQLHSIFRTFLANRLKEAPHPAKVPAEAADGADIDQPALYRRAGNWFALYGDPVRAIYFLAKAGRDEDFLRILELFARPGDGLLVLMDPEGLFSVLRSVPHHVRVRCPIGWLAFVFHYMVMVDPDLGRPLLDESVPLLMEAAELPPDERRRIAGEVELIHSALAFNDARAMFAHHARAAELLDGRPSALHLPQHVWTFGSPHVAYQYLREPGDYETLTALTLREFGHYLQVSGGCGAGLQEILTAEWRLERGELEQVEAPLLKALFKAMSKNQPTGLVAANFTLARLRLAEGKRTEALELMRDLEPTVAAAGNTLLDTLLRIAQGYIWAVAGDAEGTGLWLRQGRETVAETLRQGQTFASMVYSGALMAAGRWAELEALGETLEDDLARFRNLIGFIHALLMRSVGAYHLQGLNEALPLFIRALDLARPDGIMMTVAEYGPYIQPLVEALAAGGGKEEKQRSAGDTGGETDPYLSELLRFTRVFTALVAQGHEKPRLTPRQEDFLGLAASGASNAHIAEHFGVKPDTVKKILSEAYKRLGAQNRVEAIRLWVDGRKK